MVPAVGWVLGWLGLAPPFFSGCACRLSVRVVWGVGARGVGQFGWCGTLLGPEGTRALWWVGVVLWSWAGWHINCPPVVESAVVKVCCGGVCCGGGVGVWVAGGGVVV